MALQHFSISVRLLALSSFWSTSSGWIRLISLCPSIRGPAPSIIITDNFINNWRPASSTAYLERTMWSIPWSLSREGRGCYPKSDPVGTHRVLSERCFLCWTILCATLHQSRFLHVLFNHPASLSAFTPWGIELKPLRRIDGFPHISR